MKRIELEKYLSEILKPEIYDDYCPNGLQIEGKEEVSKIIFAVSATKESVDFAHENNADVLIVHHGLFWKFHGTKTLTGPFLKRIAPLIKKDINLIAYHLPLDGNMLVGNAAALAEVLALNNVSPFGNHKGSATGVRGEFAAPIAGYDLKKILETKLNHLVLYSDPTEKTGMINTIGIITGGANSEWKEALKLNLDAYLTGEMSEHDYHESRESGVHMFAAGHHATEKFGIQSLMKNIKNQFPQLDCQFMDSNNPA